MMTESVTDPVTAFNAKFKHSVDVMFAEDTPKPDWAKASTHAESEYIAELLIYRYNTDYDVSMGKDRNAIKYVIPAQVMTHIILTNNYKVHEKTDEFGVVSRILLPLNAGCMYSSEAAVRSLGVNSRLRVFFAKYPMMPMQHDLPMLNMPDEQFDFADWQPELPTNDNWREFKYAPTNIRMNGKTYAANCRHRTVDWDEHPWCVHCLI
jgi:hypothetical protein